MSHRNHRNSFRLRRKVFLFILGVRICFFFVFLQTQTNERKMDERVNIFAYRLVNARKIRCLSQRELCDRLNGLVSSNAIAKYETGKMIPSSPVLIAIADTLGMGVDYFFRPFTIKIDPDAWEFRKKSVLGAKKVEAIKQMVAVEIEKYAEIEDVLCCSKPFSLDYRSLSVDTEEDARTMAIRFRDDLKLGRDAISFPIELLENQGVRIVEIEADIKFDGTCIMAGSVPVIVLNKIMPPERKRFTLFHELGHLLLFFPDVSKREKLCDVFANEVLIPSEVFVSMMGKSRRDISLTELRAIQVEYGISVEALMAKASQLSIITDNRYRHFYKKMNKIPEFKSEVRRSVFNNDEHSNLFHRLVFKALASELVSFSKAASLLNKPIVEVRKELNLL